MGDKILGIGNQGTWSLFGQSNKDSNNKGINTPNGGVFGFGSSVLIRRELNHAPLFSKDAFNAYSKMRGADFADANDIRLAQLSRAAKRTNAALENSLNNLLAQKGIEGDQVSARAKSPFSLFNKLLKYPINTIGRMNDISAARFNILQPSKDWTDHKQLLEVVKEHYPGENLKIKSFLDVPTKDGYQGRIHVDLPGDAIKAQELQIGSKDLASFIDQPIQNASGESRTLHDLVYKGKEYGIKLSNDLQDGYKSFMQRISQSDLSGNSTARNTALAADLKNYYSSVAKELPGTLPSAPSPSLSLTQKIGQFASKGLGIFGAALGTYQAYNGIKEVNDGKIVDGTANIGAGTSGAASGVALIAGKAILSGGLGGVAAGIEGGKDLYDGYESGDTSSILYGSAKIGTGVAMVGGAVFAAPVVLGVGAAAYLTTVAIENREAIYNAAESTYNTVTGAASSAYNWVFGD